jgi:hypothetical protein
VVSLVYHLFSDLRCYDSHCYHYVCRMCASSRGTVIRTSGGSHIDYLGVQTALKDLRPVDELKL